MGMSSIRRWLLLQSFCIGCLLLTACKKPAEVSVVSVARSNVEATVTGVTSGTVRAEQLAELAFGAVGRVKTLHVHLVLLS